MIQKNTNECLACGSAPSRQVKFPDGIINICLTCKNQWVVANEESSETVRYNYYMEPDSYCDVTKYPPFCRLFNNLKKTFGKKTLKILDVGCGSGVFVKECLRRGHTAIGIEADEKLKRKMDPKLAKQIIFQFAEKVKGLETDFDVICFWDSFEHFKDPFFLLSQFNENLKSDGVFFIRVNNNFDIYNIFTQILLLLIPELGKKVFYQCFGRPFHYWNFSENGLKRIFKNHGFPIQKYLISETPAFRFTKNHFLIASFRLAYAINRAIGGGKIGNVYLGKRVGFCKDLN